MHCVIGSVNSYTHPSTPCAHDVFTECALVVTVHCRRTVKVCMYVCVCYIYMFYKLFTVNNNSLSAG